MNLREAAQELILDELKLPKGYERQNISFSSVRITAPSPYLDYTIGRSARRDQVTCISFSDDALTVHVYPAFSRIFGASQYHSIVIDYGDPALVETTMEVLGKIFDHHEVLREVARDDYVTYTNDMKQKGYAIIEGCELPPNHRDFDGE